MSFLQYTRYKQSGSEWLGSIPEHWAAVRIKALFEIRKRIAGELGHPVLSVTQQGLKVRDTDSNDGQLSMDYSKYQLVEPGDFVMNHMDLLTGYVDESKFHGVTSPDYRVFAARKEHLAPRYFLYLFQNGYRQRIFYAFGQGASGLGRWRMSTDSFNDFILPVAPLAEQSAIAAFLDRETAKIDALVEEQKRMIELLKEKRQAVISRAVTKGRDPNVRLSASGLEWFGEVPSHWQIKKLGYVAFMQEGPGLRNWQFTDEGTRVICVTNITDSGIDFSRLEKFISTTEYELAYKHFTVEPGDLLISSSGNSWGKVAVYKDSETVILNTSTIRLHKNVQESLSTDYLFWLLRSLLVREQLGLAMTGACQPNFGPTHLNEVVIPVPPILEQKAISEFLDQEVLQFDELVVEANYAIALLQERRSAIISAAVTGKIDVRGVTTNAGACMDRGHVRLVVAAAIIEKLSQNANFGRVKLQKLIYLTETHVGVHELHGSYLRAAAGPLDRDMIAEVETQLQRARHITVDQPGGQGNQVTYKFRGHAGAYREELTIVLGERQAKFFRLIADLGDFETKSVEAVATLYAVWNDALIDGHVPTDDAIVSGVLGEWHPDKERKFRTAELHDWLGWMRRHNIVPEGKGPRTSTGRLFL